MSTLKESKIACKVIAPGPQGKRTFDGVVHLHETECENSHFWYGIGTIAFSFDPENPPLPPCNPQNGSFRLELEDGRKGYGIIRTFHNRSDQEDYWEMEFIGISPLVGEERHQTPPPMNDLFPPSMN